MDLEDLGRLVEEASESVFRLETLAQYLVPDEADEFAAWKAGRPYPLATPDTSEWLAQIAHDVAVGCRWYRARILGDPLSEYEQFELRGYQELVAAGVEIYVADRHAHSDLDPLRTDFWLVDDATAVGMVYDTDGRFLRLDSDEDLTACREMRDAALRHAEPLAEYVARRRLRRSA